MKRAPRAREGQLERGSDDKWAKEGTHIVTPPLEEVADVDYHRLGHGRRGEEVARFVLDFEAAYEILEEESDGAIAIKSGRDVSRGLACRREGGKQTRSESRRGCPRPR